jgi:hypothetical protein
MDKNGAQKGKKERERKEKGGEGREGKGTITESG